MRAPYLLFYFFLLSCTFFHAESHNWVGQMSRNFGTASQIAPCVDPRSPKPQIQVSNRGQQFQVEWASGHGRPAFFILINYEDRDKLGEHNRNSINQYISDAFAANSPNLMVNADGSFNANQKFHRAFNNPRDLNEDDFYQRELNPGDEFYFERDPMFDDPTIGSKVGRTSYLYQYKQATLENGEYGPDAYVSYSHPEMDWIISAWRFEVWTHYPSDYDVALFKVPENTPPGRYILHYIWAGYYDCTDIDVMDQPTDVVDHFGIVNGTEFDEMRVDHCVFQSPRLFFPPAIEVINGDVTPCLDRCIRRDNQGCTGVQIFPFIPSDPVPEAWRGLNGSLWEKYIRDSFDVTTWGDTRVTGNGNRADLTRYFDGPPWFHNETDLQDQWMEMYTNGGPEKLYCIPITQMTPSNTQPSMLTSKDPRDPVFYGTCYARVPRVTFIGYDDISSSNLSFPTIYEDRCLSCESFRKNRNGQAPFWSVLGADEKCTDCSEELDVVDAEEPKPQLLPIDSGRCQLPNQWSGDTLGPTTCPADESCTVLLGPPTWWLRDSTMNEETCAMLAEAEPNCQPGSYFLADRGSSMSNARWGCRCYKQNPTCCGQCLRRSDGVATRFELIPSGETPTPDPTCARGLLDNGGNVCCEASCDACNSGQSDGTPGVCSRNRILALGTTYPEAYGGLNRTCDTYGPPCVM